MGTEFEVAWDARTRELVMTSASDRRGRLAVHPGGPDRWRGRSGMNDGEVLAVRRDRSGPVLALDIATFVFTREPWPAL